MPTSSAKCLTMSGSSVSRRNATIDIRRWMPDEEFDDGARFGRQVEPIEHLPRHAHAFDRVIVVPPFADVVEEERQHEQLRATRSASSPLKRLRLGVDGVARRSRLRIVSSVCSSTVYLW